MNYRAFFFFLFKNHLTQQFFYSFFGFFCLSFLLSSTLGTFLSSLHPEIFSQFSITTLWIVIILIACVHSVFLLHEEYSQGILTYYHTIGISPVKSLIIRFFAYYVSFLTWMIPASLLIAFLSAIDYRVLFYLFLSLLMGNAVITSYVLLGSLLSVSCKENKMLGAILILPFLLPTLFIGMSATREIGNSVLFFYYLKLQCGLIFFSLPINLLIGIFFYKEIIRD